MPRKRWYEELQSYKEIVAIEFAHDEDVLPIMEFLECELRPCPFDLIEPVVMVVPKEAIKLLPLKDVQHTQVELRDMFGVSSSVCNEINRRWNARQEPHYYMTQCTVEPPAGKMGDLLERAGLTASAEPEVMRTFYRMYVRLPTVKEIEQQLAQSPA